MREQRLTDSPRAAYSRELLQAPAEFVGFAMRHQLLPGDLALPEPGHAAHHAAQRGLDAGGNLVVRRAADNAVDERALLVAIGEGEIVFEVSVGGELAAADGRVPAVDCSHAHFCVPTISTGPA